MMMHDRRHTDSGGQMRFTCSGSTDKYDVVAVVDKAAAMACFNEGLIDPALLELEA